MQESKSLTVPRGTPNLAPMSLDMTEVYLVELRLPDIRTANPGNAQELMGTFNAASNTLVKYIAWVDYEILQAQKFLGISKATVILDKAQEELKKYPGLKNNEDFRNALIARDPECQERLDKLNGLIAVRALLDGKVKSFVRAYYTAQAVVERRGSNPSQNFTATAVGAPHENVMGAQDPSGIPYSERKY